MPSPFSECRDDRRRPRSTVRFEDPLDRSHADVWEIDRPDEHRAGLQRLKGTQGPSEGGDGAGFGLRVLYDHEVMAGQNRLNSGRIGSEDDHPSLYLERFQSLQDSDDEGETEEIQQGLGRAHPGRAASRQHDAR